MVFTNVQTELYAESVGAAEETIEQDKEQSEKQDTKQNEEYGNEGTYQRFIHGFPDGTVKADISMTRAEAAIIIFRLLEADDKFNSVPHYFSDIDENSWYCQAVNYLSHVGIILGYPDGTFKADEAINKAEFSALITRFTKSTGSTQADFADVLHNHWAISYINTVAEKGWVSGHDDNTFRPESHIARAEVVIMLNHILDRKTNPATIDESLGKNTVYSDISSQHRAFYDIMDASITHRYVINQHGSKVWLSFSLPRAQ